MSALRALREALAGAYAGEPFVCLLPEGRWPATASVAGSNGVHLQVAADHRAGRAVVVAAIDNLGKGAAGQAIQNANLMLGLPETAGLTVDRSRAMSVTAPLGFRAAGVAAGLKDPAARRGPRDQRRAVAPRRPVSSPPTGSRPRRCCGASRCVAGGSVRAVVLNSGGANACTGPAGFGDTHQTAEHLAELLGTVPAGEIAVCSTGLIGERLPMDQLLAGVDAAVHAAARRRRAGRGRGDPDHRHRRQAAVSRATGYVDRRDGQGRGDAGARRWPRCSCVLTTDADLPPASWTRRCARRSGTTFDRLDTDGCMSTNDTVLLLASGASGVAAGPAEFAALLTAACADLARQMQRTPRARPRPSRSRSPAPPARTTRSSRPRHRPVQPAQVRDRRRGPELGPRAGRGRHHQRGLRAGRARRRDQRGLGLPERRRRRTTAQGGPVGPGRDHHRRPVGRAATATVRTTDLTAQYVHENSAYST